MTRPNQARRGGSTKRGKRFVAGTKPGVRWHLSPCMSACVIEGFLTLYRADDLYCLTPPELRALYTRLWYLEKCGKLKRIKP